MVQQAQGKVILVGGLGINYKNSVVQFRQDYSSQSVNASMLLATKTKQEIKLSLGRFGHSAAYSKADHSVYIFAG